MKEESLSKKDSVPGSKTNSKKLKFWLWTVFVFVLGNFFNPIISNFANQFYRSKLETPVSRVLGDSVTLTSAKENCENLICDEFNKLGLWIGSSYFNIIENNPLTLKPPLTDKLSGWVMNYIIPVPASFEAGFSFIPQGEQPNVVFQYKDVFEVIVGDGSYSRLSVKNNGAYIAPKGYVIKHFPLPEPIQKNTIVKLNLKTRILKGTNKIIVLPSLTYYNSTGIEKNLDAPEFVVQTDDNPEALNRTIGVGLIDPQRTGKIQAIFKELTVRKNIF